MLTGRLLVLLVLTVAGVSGYEICEKVSTCDGEGGDGCYATCDNTCRCDTGDFVMYGGSCQEAGFCQGEFLHLEDCVEGGGPTCPTSMVSMDTVLESFSTYDYRIDVRSVEEWTEGHANISISTPGLAKNPASDYLDKIGGLEDSNILVYCRSGGRAFDAAQNLLRYGFSNVNSFYHGGFPDLSGAIMEQSASSEDHPTKNYCYITGPSDICPMPLSFPNIRSVEDIQALGDKILLVDVRPRRKPYLKSLKNAHRVSKSPKKVAKFLESVEEGSVIVVFCAEGTLAFQAAKEFVAQYSGKVVFIDNGGYSDIKKIRGIHKI